MQKMDWDAKLDADLETKWKEIATSLQDIPAYPIQRYIGIQQGVTMKYDCLGLHVPSFLYRYLPSVYPLVCCCLFPAG